MGGTEAASKTPAGLPRRRFNPYAACVVQFGDRGKVHLYLNAGIPRGHHPSEGICTKCKHAYSHHIGDGKPTCEECEGEGNC